MLCAANRVSLVLLSTLDRHSARLATVVDERLLLGLRLAHISHATCNMHSDQARDQEMQELGGSPPSDLATSSTTI